MQIIFFGSSEFSIPALKACLDSPHQISLIITTPDKKQGRGLKLAPTPVCRYAEQSELPVVRIPSLKDAAWFEKVKGLKPDLFVVASYGKLIPSDWLEIPSVLALNVHPSLLPKYRGASPLHWPIIEGDSETGISIAEVTSRLDSGDIFYQEKMPLDARMDSEKLSGVLAGRAYDALLKVFQRIEEKKLTRMPQKEEDASYARKLTKEDGRVSFHKTAVELDRLIRGLKPWPGSFFEFQDTHVLILDAEACRDNPPAKPGTFIEAGKDGSISIRAREGLLKIHRVRPAGKKEMPAADFARGRRLPAGFIFP